MNKTLTLPQGTDREKLARLYNQVPQGQRLMLALMSNKKAIEQELKRNIESGWSDQQCSDIYNQAKDFFYSALQHDSGYVGSIDEEPKFDLSSEKTWAALQSGYFQIEASYFIASFADWSNEAFKEHPHTCALIAKIKGIIDLMPIVTEELTNEPKQANIYDGLGYQQNAYMLDTYLKQRCNKANEEHGWITEGYDTSNAQVDLAAAARNPHTSLTTQKIIELREEVRLFGSLRQALKKVVDDCPVNAAGWQKNLSHFEDFERQHIIEAQGIAAGAARAAKNRLDYLVEQSSKGNLSVHQSTLASAKIVEIIAKTQRNLLSDIFQWLYEESGYAYLIAKGASQLPKDTTKGTIQERGGSK